MCLERGIPPRATKHPKDRKGCSSVSREHEGDGPRNLRLYECDFTPGKPKKAETPQQKSDSDKHVLWLLYARPLYVLKTSPSVGIFDGLIYLSNQFIKRYR